MTHFEFCSFCIKILGFWLFTGSLFKVGDLINTLLTQDSVFLAMMIPNLLSLGISILCLLKTNWIVRLVFKTGLEEQKPHYSSRAIVLLWGLSGLIMVIYGITDLVSIPVTRFVYFQMDPSPYKQLSDYNFGYKSMVLAAIKIVFGLLFMMSWSREGLRNILGLASRFDASMAAMSERLEDQEDTEQENK